MANYLRRILTLKNATAEHSSSSGGVVELVALKPEWSVNTRVAVNSQPVVDNWDDEF